MTALFTYKIVDRDDKNTCLKFPMAVCFDEYTAECAPRRTGLCRTAREPGGRFGLNNGGCCNFHPEQTTFQ